MKRGIYLGICLLILGLVVIGLTNSVSNYRQESSIIWLVLVGLLLSCGGVTLIINRGKWQ